MKVQVDFGCASFVVGIYRQSKNGKTWKKKNRGNFVNFDIFISLIKVVFMMIGFVLIF